MDAPPGEVQGTQRPRDVGRGSGGFRRPAARPRTWCRSQDSCPVTLRPHARGGGRGHFRGHGPHGPSLRPQSAPLFPSCACRAPFPRPLRVGPLSWPNTSSMRVLRPHLGVPKVCLSFLLSYDEPPPSARLSSSSSHGSLCPQVVTWAGLGGRVVSVPSGISGGAWRGWRTHLGWPTHNQPAWAAARAKSGPGAGVPVPGSCPGSLTPRRLRSPGECTRQRRGIL